MKNIRLLLALAVASFVTVSFVNAEEAHKEEGHKAAAKAKCCKMAEKKGEKCGHECCVEAAKADKPCEKCSAKKEEKK